MIEFDGYIFTPGKRMLAEIADIRKTYDRGMNGNYHKKVGFDIPNISRYIPICFFGNIFQ